MTRSLMRRQKWFGQYEVWDKSVWIFTTFGNMYVYIHPRHTLTFLSALVLKVVNPNHICKKHIGRTKRQAMNEEGKWQYNGLLGDLAMASIPLLIVLKILQDNKKGPSIQTQHCESSLHWLHIYTSSVDSCTQPLFVLYDISCIIPLCHLSSTIRKKKKKKEKDVN